MVNRLVRRRATTARPAARARRRLVVATDAIAVSGYVAAAQQADQATDAAAQHPLTMVQGHVSAPGATETSRPLAGVAAVVTGSPGVLNAENRL